LCAALGLQSLSGVDATALIQPSPNALPRSVTAKNASVSDIQTARLIVKNAIAKMTELNKARLAKPAPNNFKLKPGTKLSRRDDVEAPPPLLNVTDEIASAAALLAELDTEPLSANETSNAHSAAGSKRAAAFWMEGITRRGTVPWGNDGSYKVCLARWPLERRGADCDGPRSSEMSSTITVPIRLASG
jgi:hypothetical protein